MKLYTENHIHFTKVFICVGKDLLITKEAYELSRAKGCIFVDCNCLEYNCNKYVGKLWVGTRGKRYYLNSDQFTKSPSSTVKLKPIDDDVIL